MARYVNADAFAESLRRFCKNAHWGYAEQKFSADQIIGALEMQPTADVREVKHGHWERHNTYHGDDTSGSIDPDWRCSECGRQANVNEWFMYVLTDFCPNCGADMREK
jgi:hypothetical protein